MFKMNTQKWTMVFTLGILALLVWNEIRNMKAEREAAEMLTVNPVEEV